MKCPICKKKVELRDPFMPFCSDRCRLIDLGKWADEEYRIPGEKAGPEIPRDRDSDGKELDRGDD